jgi:hypothetical protein
MINRASQRAVLMAGVAVVAMSTWCPPAAMAQPIVFAANGPDAASIQPAVDAFRAALGSDNGIGGTFASGRREVNWDTIPLQFLDPFPGGFFNANSPRGLVLSTPGPRMKVSGDSGSDSFLMADVTAQQWGLVELDSFSPQRIFAPLGSTVTDAHFFVPGTTVPGGVRGFGAVFVDVDLPGATSLELFDEQDASLFEQFVAPSGAVHKGMSFLGVILPENELATRVRMISGNFPMDTGFMDPPPDGVAIDDLIYAEPVAVPEPAGALVAAVAAAGSVLMRRRRSPVERG